MKILGIESTCDETSVGIVEDGSIILASVTASSADLQEKYGGVVPEVAAREQVKVMIPVIREALEQAFAPQVDAIAAAYGPGLIGSLLIGVETSKALSLAWNKPLIGINHLIGHIYSNWLESNSKPEFPLLALVVSGGHTDLVLMADHGKYKLLGSTLDDAAGEAFDKVAKHLGLSYPGGPEIERVALHYAPFDHSRGKQGKPSVDRNLANFKFPRPMISSEDFDFSFSGLKTAVVNYINQLSDVRSQISVIAYEFQEAVVDVLTRKTITAAKKFSVKSIVVGGGVAANSLLRRRMLDVGEINKIKVYFPSVEFSVDNGAMIAAAAFHNFKKVSAQEFIADPSLHF